MLVYIHYDTTAPPPSNISPDQYTKQDYELELGSFLQVLGDEISRK